MTFVTFAVTIVTMKIKELRQQLGLTQEKLAQKLGVSSMTIKRWEAGVNEPSSLAMRQIEALQKEQTK